jgi:hypothetical protein
MYEFTHISIMYLCPTRITKLMKFGLLLIIRYCFAGLSNYAVMFSSFHFMKLLFPLLTELHLEEFSFSFHFFFNEIVT